MYPTYGLAPTGLVFLTRGFESVPIHAFDLIPLLTGGPLLEACLVDVIAAGRFAPDYLLGRGFELREANGTVAVDGFAFARVIVVAACFVIRGRGRVGEDFMEFLVAVSRYRLKGSGRCGVRRR